MTENSKNLLEIRLISTETNQNSAFEIRKLVFQIGQNVDPAFDNDGEDAKDYCYGFLAFLNNTPVGTCRLRKASNYYLKLERVAVLNEFRRNLGVGSALLNFAQKFASENFPAFLIKSLCQLDVVPFYKKCGYVVVDENDVIFEQNIAHYMMFLRPTSKSDLANLHIWNEANEESDLGQRHFDKDKDALIRALKKLNF